MFLFKAYSRIEFFFFFFLSLHHRTPAGKFHSVQHCPLFWWNSCKETKEKKKSEGNSETLQPENGSYRIQVLAVIDGLWAGKQEENGSAHSKGYLKMENPSVLDRFTWHHYSTTDEKFSVLGYCYLINGLYLLASCCVRVCFALCLLLICSWSLSLFCLLSHSTCSLNVLMKDRQVISVRASALTDVL